MHSRLVRLLAWLLLSSRQGAAAGEASIRERLATALPERGQQLFLVCRACHSTDAAAELERVVGYLSTHYGPDRPNFPQH